MINRRERRDDVESAELASLNQAESDNSVCMELMIIY